MQQSKLVLLLQAMPIGQFEELCQFLKSPFFKISAPAVALFQYLKPAYPSFVQSEKIKAFQHVFPEDKNYGAQKLNKVMWQLLTAADHFLSVSEFIKDGFLQQRMLMNAYLKLNDKATFTALATASVDRLMENEEKHFIYHFDLFRLNYELQQVMGAKLSGEPLALKAACLHLDKFYLSAKLWLETELTNRQHLLSESANYFILEDISYLRIVAAQQSDPFLQTCLQFIEIIKGEQTIDHEKIQVLLNQNLPRFSHEIQSAVLLYLLNLLNTAINNGQLAYLPIRFEVYKLGVEKGIFIQHNRMTEISFINIIIAACLTNEFDFAEDFINKYSKFIDTDLRINAMRLGRAYLCFHKKQFDHASTLLVKVQFSTLESKLWAYSLLSRSYYESFIRDKKNDRILKSFLATFEKFIRSNRSLSEAKKAPYMHYIIALKEMIRLNKEMRPLYLGNGYSFLLKYINNQSIIAKGWLLEKLDYLRKGHNSPDDMLSR